MKGLYDNEMKLEFSSKTSNEAFARVAVAAFVSQLDPTIDELSDIKTAVSEAVTNSIIHGYGEDSDGLVKIEAKIFLDTVQIEISDTGKGIEDVEMAMRPLYTSKPDLERSGMGFTIMESFMDEIKVESALGFGTKVFLKKKITSKNNQNDMDEEKIDYINAVKEKTENCNSEQQFELEESQNIENKQSNLNIDLDKIKNDIKNILEA